MTGRRGFPVFISYSVSVVLCAMVVGGMFGLFVLGSAFLALLALILGAVAWGSAARALRMPSLALPVIALAVELLVAFEFKRLYVLDYVGGPPRSLGVFTESLFISDLIIVGLLVGFGSLGWHWQRRRVGVTA